MSRPSSSNNSVYLRGWGTGYLGMWVGVCCGGGGYSHVQSTLSSAFI